MYPQYQKDTRLNLYKEVSIPPEKEYYGVGYAGVLTDQEPEPNHLRHYRKIYRNELEKNKELFPIQPFDQYPIVRGQSTGAPKSFF